MCEKHSQIRSKPRHCYEAVFLSGGCLKGGYSSVF